MNLLSNPILLSYRRMAHRAGVWPGVALSLLVSLCMLLALFLSEPTRGLGRRQLGGTLYGWLFIIEGALLTMGCFSRISGVLIEERNSGMLDSNRLTTMSPASLTLGYWLGPPVRLAAMAAALLPVAVAIVLASDLPLEWLVVPQALLLSTALLVGLLSVVVGLGMKKAQGAAVSMFLGVTVGPLSLAMSNKSLSTFLVPTYAIEHVFRLSHNYGPLMGTGGLAASVYFFKVPPVYYTGMVQLAFGAFLWMAAVRKFNDLQGPLWSRWQGLGLMTLFLVLQHGLVWPVWHGKFPDPFSKTLGLASYIPPTLGLIHSVTLLLGVLLLASLQPAPERIRLALLRGEIRGLRGMLSRSAMPTALAMAVAGSLVTATHFMDQPGVSFTWIIASVNLLVVLVTCVALLDLCRLYFGRRAPSVMLLAFGVLYGLPLLLGLVLQSPNVALTALPAPAVALLADPRELMKDKNLLLNVSLAHLAIMMMMLVFWAVSWRRWLQRQTPAAG